MAVQYVITKKNRALFDVLEQMPASQLIYMRKSILKSRSDTYLGHEELRWKTAADIFAAAAHSFKFWAAPKTYDEVVCQVAKRLNLPAPTDSPVAEIERAILFKVVEKSLERMTSKEKKELATKIENDLKSMGIDRKVAFAEVKDFVKFMAMDVGGTVGGLVLAAPGLSGVVGLNFLQWIVLKGVVLTSGHLAAGGALLGFGAGGTLMAFSGAAGPIGGGLALVYTAYVLAGPAYRKLIPAVCFIAAKRIELSVPVTYDRPSS